MSAAERAPLIAELAQQQADLVRALVAGAAIPPGFDAAAVTAATHALLHKRAGEVARRYPALVHACGGTFTARFIAWAQHRPKTSTAADATAFANSEGITLNARVSRRTAARLRTVHGRR